MSFPIKSKWLRIHKISSATRSRTCFYACCIGLFYAITPLSSTLAQDGNSVQISVSLKELSNNQLIDAKITLERLASSEEFVRKSKGVYSFKGVLGAANLEEYKVILQPNSSSYFSRSIPMKGEIKQGKLTIPLTLYLAKKTEFTDEYLEKGLRYLRLENFDGALAYYEPAFLEENQNLARISALSDYQIKLDYNYARTLHKLCVQSNYNTCGQSIRIFQFLRRVYDRYGRDGEFYAIDMEDLSQAVGAMILHDREVKVRYGKMQKLFANRKYLEAADLAIGIFEDCKAISFSLCSRISLSKERLINDIKTSYNAAGQERAPGENEKMKMIQRKIEELRS